MWWVLVIVLCRESHVVETAERLRCGVARDKCPKMHAWFPAMRQRRILKQKRRTTTTTTTTTNTTTTNNNNNAFPRASFAHTTPGQPASTEFMAYMDGKSEKDIIWCPGVVCSKQSGESGGAPVSSEAGGAGLVVDVMGQAEAEFPVTEDNLTGFPGFAENLETVRNAVEEGLVSLVKYLYFKCFLSRCRNSQPNPQTSRGTR